MPPPVTMPPYQKITWLDSHGNPLPIPQAVTRASLWPFHQALENRAKERKTENDPNTLWALATIKSLIEISLNKEFIAQAIDAFKADVDASVYYTRENGNIGGEARYYTNTSLPSAFASYRTATGNAQNGDEYKGHVLRTAMVKVGNTSYTYPGNDLLVTFRHRQGIDEYMTPYENAWETMQSFNKADQDECLDAFLDNVKAELATGCVNERSGAALMEMTATVTEKNTKMLEESQFLKKMGPMTAAWYVEDLAEVEKQFAILLEQYDGYTFCSYLKEGNKEIQWVIHSENADRFKAQVIACLATTTQEKEEDIRAKWQAFSEANQLRQQALSDFNTIEATLRQHPRKQNTPTLQKVIEEACAEFQTLHQNVTKNKAKLDALIHSLQFTLDVMNNLDDIGRVRNLQNNAIVNPDLGKGFTDAFSTFIETNTTMLHRGRLREYVNVIFSTVAQDTLAQTEEKFDALFNRYARCRFYENSMTDSSYTVSETDPSWLICMDTNKFKAEVIALLKQNPQNSMACDILEIRLSISQALSELESALVRAKNDSVTYSAGSTVLIQSKLECTKLLKDPLQNKEELQSLAELLKFVTDAVKEPLNETHVNNMKHHAKQIHEIWELDLMISQALSELKTAITSQEKSVIRRAGFAVLAQGRLECTALLKNPLKNKEKLNAFAESLRLATAVVKNPDKTHADNLKENAKQAAGKASLSKKFVAVLGILAGAAIIGLGIAGAAFTGGASAAAGIYTGGSVLTASSAGLFYSGRQKNFSKKLSSLANATKQKTPSRKG